MADSADALIRSGVISGKQAGKHKLAPPKKAKKPPLFAKGNGAKGQLDDIDEIDDAPQQKPNFPAQGAGKPASFQAPKQIKKKPPLQGGEYGGGGRNTQ